MKRAYIYDDGSRHILVRGNTRQALKGVPGMRSARDRGLWVRRERLGDVLARLEIAGMSVDVIEGGPR